MAMIDLSTLPRFGCLALLLCVGLWIFGMFMQYMRLRRVPGPFLAAFTNVPRTLWVLTGRAHDLHIKLHRQYGPLVRFGPNMVSVGDPAEISIIYGFDGKFNKSAFYRVLLLYANGKPVPTIFALQDQAVHRTLRRPIAGMYSNSKVMALESFVDITMQSFIDRLNELFVQTNSVCDLGKWLRLFTFDAMGELTFSKPLRFMETGGDVDGIIASIWDYFWKAAPITQIPWVDWLWMKNPLLQWSRTASQNPIVTFGLERIKARTEELESGKQGSRSGNADFLAQFMEALENDKSTPRWALTAWMTSNITAGSDTTAILLRTLFYNLLIHPQSMATLVAEIRDAERCKRLSVLAPWKEAQALPYLGASIKEAGRMHPPFGLPLERVVPDQGAVICGQYLPAGTVVGTSAWVVHRNEEIFGTDCDRWRPERWLCDGPQRRRMENALMTFGAGSRSCIGKHIAYMEIYKLVPTLLQAYEFVPAGDLRGKWDVQNRWFVNQTGLEVLVKRRAREDELEFPH